MGVDSVERGGLNSHAIPAQSFRYSMYTVRSLYSGSLRYSASSASLRVGTLTQGARLVSRT